MLTTGKDKSIRIIDRTLPEMLPSPRKVSRLDLIQMCWMLRDLGVDLIEINSAILRKLGNLPSGLDFLLRVESEEDILQSITVPIEHCVVYEGMLLNTGLIEVLYFENKRVMVECKIENLMDIYRLRRLKKLSCIDFIHGIRLSGLSSFTSQSWIRAVHQMARILKKPIDVCPENRYYSATAIGADALFSGIGSLTVSFTGYGKQNGYSALEEVLAITKVLLYPYSKIDLHRLPELSQKFTALTGMGISPNKPVLGKNIFVYESGIHADGIEKNPASYEPFDPETVGQERRLSIGKHSGKRAVLHKLRELGVRCKTEEAAEMLNPIREKSMQLGRSLKDEEIVGIYRRMRS